MWAGVQASRLHAEVRWNLKRFVSYIKMESTSHNLATWRKTQTENVLTLGNSMNSATHHTGPSPTTFAFVGFLVAFAMLLVLSEGCLKGTQCRTDTSCPSQHVCRGGECLPKSSLLATGSKCRGDFECLSQRCQSGLCKTIAAQEEKTIDAGVNKESSKEQTSSEETPESPESSEECKGKGCGIWSVRGGGAGDDYGTALAVDKQERVYVATVLDSVGDIGGKTIHARGRQDVALVRYDSEGKMDWSFIVGGVYQDLPRSIVLDDKGNVYISGQFRDEFHSGGPVVKTRGEEDADSFVIKYSAQGKFLWVQNFGVPGRDDSADKLAMDADGFLYVLGHFRGTGKFGSTTLVSPNPNATTMFIVKLHPDGTILWAKSFGGGRDVVGTGFVPHPKTGLYLAGTFLSSFTLGGQQLEFKGKGNDNDIFLAKLASDGRIEWAKRYGGTPHESIATMAIAPQGHLYLGGFFKQTLTLGTLSISTSSALHGFVAKFDAMGEPQWAKALESSKYSHVLDLATTPKGGAVLTGFFTNDCKLGSLLSLSVSTPGNNAMVAEISSAGDWQWARHLQSPKQSRGMSVVVSQQERIYVTGRFQDKLSLPKHHVLPHLDSKGGFDMFLMLLR